MAPTALQGLRSVRGQDHTVALLARAARAGRLASGYLFEGPEGVGKERAARALAQVTVCAARRDDGDACGECVECRHVAAGTHVDVLTLAREIDVLSQTEHRPRDIRSEIVVDKVRTLQTERLAYHSHHGARWIVVRNAHEMNAAASNALLKTLEEPAPNTRFVLVSAEPALLLNTIRSRCQRVRFGPLPDAVVAELLAERGIDAAAAADVARVADGSMARALELLEGDALPRRRRFVERILAALGAGRPGGFVELGEELKALAKDSKEKDKKSAGPVVDEVGAVLAMLQRHFRDEALTHAGTQARRAVVCAARAELVRDAMDSLERGNNLNLQMVVESMLVRLREARA